MHRPLPAALVLSLVLATAVSLEVWTRAVYRTHDGLLEKARRFTATARDADKNLVVLGTCLPAQHLRTAELQAQLGGGWVVHNLGNEATNTLDWYLAYANELPATKVDAVVLGYGEHDLLARISPWESRVLDLTTWGDVPELADFACQQAECRTDLAMRKASVFWRNRIRVSNMIWLALGALPREAPLTPPVSDDDGTAPQHYLDRLVAAVRDDGIPLYFLPLPARPGAFAADPNARVVHPEVPRLTIPTPAPAAFENQTHLTEAGSKAMTADVATALRAVLGATSSGAQ